MYGSAPAPFPGTADEIAANEATHWFDGIDGRCMDCDRRPGSISAQWPCGTPVPRVEFGSREEATAGVLASAAAIFAGMPAS